MHSTNLKTLFLSFSLLTLLPAITFADVLCERNGDVKLFRKVTKCAKGFTAVNLDSLAKARSVAAEPGESGAKGDKGDTGVQGIQGPKGDKGDTGAQGIQGVKGDKGEKGDAGPAGAAAAGMFWSDMGTLTDVNLENIDLENCDYRLKYQEKDASQVVNRFVLLSPVHSERSRNVIDLRISSGRLVGGIADLSTPMLSQIDEKAIFTFSANTDFLIDLNRTAKTQQQSEILMYGLDKLSKLRTLRFDLGSTRLRDRFGIDGLKQYYSNMIIPISEIECNSYVGYLNANGITLDPGSTPNEICAPFSDVISGGGTAASLPPYGEAFCIYGGCGFVSGVDNNAQIICIKQTPPPSNAATQRGISVGGIGGGIVSSSSLSSAVEKNIGLGCSDVLLNAQAMHSFVLQASCR